jgi:hypothetical protein
VNQRQVKELLEVLRAIDGKLELLLRLAQQPAPPVISAGLLPDDQKE